MKVREALDIVYDLAEQNALDCRCDPPLCREAKRQRKALNVVHDFIVNVVSKGRFNGKGGAKK